MEDPVSVNDLTLATYASSTSEDAVWSGACLAAGGFGPRESTVMYFEVPPGRRLGRHHNTGEETHYYVGGRGELSFDSSSRTVSQGDLAFIPEGTVHDLRNTGDQQLRVIGFFPAARVLHVWNEDVWGGQTVTASPDA